MYNYIRYIVVIILLASLFFTYNIAIDKPTFKTLINKKMPLIIKKRGFNITLKRVDILSVKSSLVTSKIDALVELKKVNKIIKFIPKKSLNLNITTTFIPKIDGKYMYFKVLSFEINRFLKVKHLAKSIRDRLEKIKVHIKSLDKISYFADIKKINFLDNGSLIIKISVKVWIILFIVSLFLLREIGLILIILYQKFISPRKKYRCAKGLLYKNGTCSSVTKEAFKKGGFIAGMKTYFKTTKECKKAYKEIKKGNNDSYVLANCACASCSSAPCDILSSSSSPATVCDATPCVISPCDIGSC